MASELAEHLVIIIFHWRIIDNLLLQSFKTAVHK